MGDDSVDESEEVLDVDATAELELSVELSDVASDVGAATVGVAVEVGVVGLGVDEGIVEVAGAAVLLGAWAVLAS